MSPLLTAKRHRRSNGQHDFIGSVCTESSYELCWSQRSLSGLDSFGCPGTKSHALRCFFPLTRVFVKQATACFGFFADDFCGKLAAWLDLAGIRSGLNRNATYQVINVIRYRPAIRTQRRREVEGPNQARYSVKQRPLSNVNTLAKSSTGPKHKVIAFGSCLLLLIRTSSSCHQRIDPG